MRAQGQAWENQAGGGFAWSLTGGALCPGCPHLEGWPSTSPLNPAPLFQAALGHLPATHPLRVSVKSPSPPPSCRPSKVGTPLEPGLHILWVHAALPTHCGPESLLFPWWWESHSPITEGSVRSHPAQGKEALVGLQTVPLGSWLTGWGTSSLGRCCVGSRMEERPQHCTQFLGGETHPQLE